MNKPKSTRSVIVATRYSTKEVSILDKKKKHLKDSLGNVISRSEYTRMRTLGEDLGYKNLTKS